MTADFDSSWPELPLLRNELVVEAPADCKTLAKRYTQEASDFGRNSVTNRFFSIQLMPCRGGQIGPFQLYDVDSDLGEITNLAPFHR